MKDRAEQKRFEKDAEKRLTLNTKLILVIAGSLLLAVVLFFIWLKTTVYVIDKKYLNEATGERKKRLTVSLIMSVRIKLNPQI